MILFQPVLALLGFAVLAAGYSMPGAYERVYFYYAYRMDQMSSKNPTIAAGCRGAKGGPCNLNEFIQYVSKEKLTGVAVTTEEFPNVKTAAQEIAKNKKYTGIMDINKVVQNAQNDYAVLLRKVGDKVTGKLDAAPINTAELEVFQQCGKRAVIAMDAVLKERGKAAIETFEPRIPGPVEGETVALEVVTKLDKQKNTIIDPVKTAADKIEVKKLGELWQEHIRGGHKENLDTLKEQVNKAKLSALCNGSIPIAKRDGGGVCSRPRVEDDWLFPGKGSKVSASDKVPGKLGKHAELAERISEERFDKLTTKRGLKKFAQEKWGGKSLSEVRGLLNYKKLTAESPTVRVGKFKAGGVVNIVGDGLWVYGVVEAFREHMSGLQRLAAVTAIFPIIGCLTQGLADLDGGGVVGSLDTALCALGDALMLTGNIPAGIVAHLIRFILGFFTPPPHPTLDRMQAQRDRIWHRFIKNDIYAYIYSHEDYDRVTGRAPSQELAFRDKLLHALNFDAFDVVSQAAQTIGAAVASAQDSLEAAADADARTKIEADVADVEARLEAATDREVLRRQRRRLLALPQSLKEEHDLSLAPVAAGFNADFIANITSPAMVRKYASPEWVDEATGQIYDNSDRIRQELAGIGAALRANPPAPPPYFHLAFVLGQSRVLKRLPAELLSAPALLRDAFPTLSAAQVHTHALHQTLQVARLLLGDATEAQLAAAAYPDPADARGRRDLQTLVALSYGQVAEDNKVYRAKQTYPGDGLWALDLGGARGDRDALEMVNPEVPPEIPLLTGPHAVALASGLGLAIVESVRAQEAELAAGFNAAAEELADKLRRHEAAAAVAAGEKAKRGLPRSAAAFRAQMAATA